MAVELMRCLSEQVSCERGNVSKGIEERRRDDSERDSECKVREDLSERIRIGAFRKRGDRSIFSQGSDSLRAVGDPFDSRSQCGVI